MSVIGMISPNAMRIDAMEITARRSLFSDVIDGSAGQVTLAVASEPAFHVVWQTSPQESIRQFSAWHGSPVSRSRNPSNGFQEKQDR
jgi:hypothetical protein